MQKYRRIASNDTKLCPGTLLAATKCNLAGTVATETKSKGRGHWFVSGRFHTSERQGLGEDVDEPSA